MRIVSLLALILATLPGCVNTDAPRATIGPDPDARDWNTTIFERGLLPRDRSPREFRDRDLFDEDDDD